MRARGLAVAGVGLAMILAACGSDNKSARRHDDGASGGAATSERRRPAAARRRRRRRRVRRRRVVEQLPGRALGQVGRAGDQGRRSRPAAASYISNDAKSSAETQASNVENLISQGANVLIILAQDGTAIKPSVAERDPGRRPGHRLRPPDRGPEGALHHLRQRRSGSLQAEAIFERRAEGQLGHHQGQQGRRQRRLPALRHGGGHR